MKVLCSKCGYPNELKKVSFKEPTQRFTCTRCGRETELKTGTVGVFWDKKPQETTAGVRRVDTRRASRGRTDAPSPEPELFEPGEDLSPFPRERSEENRGEAASLARIPKKFRIFGVFMAMVIVAVALSTLGTLYYRIKATEAVNTAKTYVMESPEVAMAAGKPAKIELSQVQFAKDGRGIERARLAMKVAGSDRTITVVTYLKKNGDWAVTSVRYLDSSGTERSLGPG